MLLAVFLYLLWRNNLGPGRSTSNHVVQWEEIDQSQGVGVWRHATVAGAFLAVKFENIELTQNGCYHCSEDLIGSYCYCATRELEKGCHLVNDRSCRGDMKIVLERCMDKNSGTLNLLVVFVSERCMDKISGTLNLLGARGRQSEEFWW